MNNSSATQQSNGSTQGSRQQTLWLETVAGLARRLSLTTEQVEIIRTATKMVGEAFDIEKCVILRYDEPRQMLLGQAPAYGLDPMAVDAIQFSVKEGTLLRALWERGEPCIVDDMATDPRFEKYRDMAQTVGLQTLLMGALRVGPTRLGALLWANKRSGERFNQTDKQWFRVLADQISIGLHHAEVVSAQAREIKRKSTLAEIAGLLHTTLNRREVMRMATSMMVGAAGADRGHLFLIAEKEPVPALSVARTETGTPRWRVSDTVDAERARWFHEHWHLFDRDQITIIEDTFYSPLIPSSWTTQLRIKSLLLVPLLAKGMLIGFIMLEDVDDIRQIINGELAFLEAVAHHSAMALVNAEQYQSLQQELEPLRANTMTYVPLAQGSGAAILVIQEGRYGYATGAAMELLGYTLDELVQMNVGDLFMPESREAVVKTYEWIRAGKRVPSLDAWALAKDGREVLLTLIGSLIDFEGAPAVELVATDTTEQQMARDRQLQASKLEAVTRLIGNLVGEVRNALTPVVGYTELTLELPDLSPELKSNLEIIAHGAERAKRTFDTLATWAEIRQPAITQTNINQLLEQMMALRQYELQGYHIQVTMDLDESLNKLSVLADPQQLQVAFLAIVDNAKDALLDVAHDRQLTIQTRRQTRGVWMATDVIVVSFQDNGPGIAREHLTRVFDPFFSTKPPTQALGLGLWIAYQIIKNHDGEIYVRSREHQGANFIVELPLPGAQELLGE
ncbi:MAG: ATP-binding protein [Acidobacteriota bacterium]|nr:ATP-binding protein [Blastocatellia bacterium]MDW8238433.1 ATP-binding protein [Acidobacteriota bacterium]